VDTTLAFGGAMKRSLMFLQFMEACTKIGEIYISYATKAYRSKGVGREMEGTR